MTTAFSPGEKLKPKALQGLYGCSANTVRDVLLRLSKVGLVEFEMQRGFRAADTSTERRRDVTKFRILLEQEGATLSMMHGGVDWEARLFAAHDKLSHIETQIANQDVVQPFIDLWSDAEIEFHQTLISECRSPLLRETYATFMYNSASRWSVRNAISARTTSRPSFPNTNGTSTPRWPATSKVANRRSTIT